MRSIDASPDRHGVNHSPRSGLESPGHMPGFATARSHMLSHEWEATRLRRRPASAAVIAGSALALLLWGCVGPLHERTVYEQGETRIGLETDPTTHTKPASLNNHPYQISAGDMRALLHSVEVSGWSGIVLGLFERPNPVPVFTNAELDLVSRPMAQAFQHAGPGERVFFSIPGSQAPYPSTKERTSGAIFFRDRYAHMVLTDHYAFTSADPGGGEERDPRDTKGMRLWISAPARPPSVPKEQEPQWAPFEKVHITLNVADVLAAQRVQPSRAGAVTSVPSDSAVQAPTPTRREAVPRDTGNVLENSERADLQLQIRELTNANLDLRGRLNEQAAEIETLRREMDRLRKELSRRPQKPPRTSPTPP
jgi:hypothetical protein